MSLESKLAGLSDAEADKYLAEIWKAFEGTEQHEALMRTITRLATAYDPILYDLRATSDQRSFACGFLAAFRTLASTLQYAFNPPPAAEPAADSPKPFDVIDNDPEADHAQELEDADTIY
jgi:hypothetical protein